MPNFSIDQTRMNEIVQRVHDASQNREGIFAQTWWWKLPQHNLPNEFEYAKYFEVTDQIPVMKVKKPKPAAMWLMQRVTCESGINSDYLTARFLELWDNPETKWFFDPKKVAKATDTAIEDIIIGKVRYSYMGKGGQFTARNFKENAQRLLNSYDGDPRNIINNVKTEEAQRRLQEFRNFGPGLTDLLISEYAMREIAKTSDTDEMSIKADIHKMRIPINCGGIVLNPGRPHLHHYELEQILPKKGYRTSFQQLGLKAEDMDNKLWLIGTDLCTHNNYDACKLCPLIEICEGNVFYERGKAHEDAPRKYRQTGRLQVFVPKEFDPFNPDANLEGELVRCDTRTNKHKLHHDPRFSKFNQPARYLRINHDHIPSDTVTHEQESLF